MRFIDKCNDLIDFYKDETYIRSNGTVLLSGNGGLACKHMFFRGITEELLNKLTNSYRGKLPESYIDFLKFSNGANLYWATIKFSDSIKFSQSMLCIYGLPAKRPCNYEEEPFDVRIEDLARHKTIPEHWLKVGSHIPLNDTSGNLHDLFIDTLDYKVYSCIKNDSNIEKIWNSLDECLCELSENLSEMGEIIEMNLNN